MTSPCGCQPGRCPRPPGHITIPPQVDPEYEKHIAPVRAAREAEITNLNHGIATYNHGSNT